MHFKPGDLVRLKSGGPQMTIEEVEDRALCSWFNYTMRERGTFALVALEHCERRQGTAAPPDYDPWAI